ncbi:calcium-binding protein [Paracoccus shanxieyensis]|uniref:Calcium-binding protein n=1 Tax=Paracoccus shanxieyensis TaxID=2675752 RepID=A0A6L6IW30_9RHOB|nr:calcium-binding protein [Paracoccus shanxieyensis]MTH64109.1 hypothetical protein [Paracoccus shanxieyensis]MTH86850.1 hypothetical protein [Paracoccus shanxieyensis]
MSATTEIRMINLQVVAEKQIQADKAAGTYESNLASDDKYYLWQSDFQTRPMGMENKPEEYAQLLRQSLPDITTIRIPFNEYSFSSNGTLDPMFTRFLVAAAEQGFDFVFVYADGDAQRLGQNDGLGLDQIREGLSGEVHDRMISGWTKMLDWLDDHETVRDAIYALEAINEPAAYSRAEQLAGNTGEFVRMYGDHIAALSQMLDARLDVPMMVGGWAYSALFDVFAQTISSDLQTTVLDQIRAAVGDDLIWSAHLYPNWAASAGQEIDGLVDFIARRFAVLGDDNIFLTETNLDPSTAMSFWMARAYEAFADVGIGISWFPAAEAGASSFVHIGNGRHINYVHPDIYALGMNAFLLGYSDPDHAASENITATLLPGNVLADDGTRLPLLGMGYATGHGGNDTISGIAQARNMLYGGAGDDLLLGTVERDHLFGQADNDTLMGLGGHDVLMGGDGDDVLDGGAGDDILTGGRGRDTFILTGGGADLVSDLRFDQGDSLIIEGRQWSEAELLELGIFMDADGDGLSDDLIIEYSNGTGIFLNMRRPDGIVQGTEQSELIQVGYTDIQGDSFTWAGARVHALGGDDTVYGSTSDDTLNGGAGNDVIYGRVGNDVLAGGDGDDLLAGDGGADQIEGGAGADTITGNADADTLWGGAGNDSLDGGDGNDHMFGDSGSDTMFGGAGHDYMYGGDDADSIQGGFGNETIFGGDGDDWIDGNGDHDWIDGGTGNDTLIGSGGNDTLTGGQGNDVMVGGAGDDVYFVDDPGDTVTEKGNGGTDHVFSSISYALGANLENLTLTAGNSTGSGNSLGNMLVGSAGNNLLDGLTGNDTLDGGVGNDTLIGGTGDDYLIGGAGRDRLTGGAGADLLSGGDGADVFVFLALSDSRPGAGLRDTITYFKHSQGDRIDLSAMNPQGDAALSYIGAADFSGRSGELAARATAAGTLIAADMNGDRISDFEILIENSNGLVASSFIL